MLVFNLKKEWFDKIATGKKTVEYRLVKPHWISRVNNALKEYKGISLSVYLENKRLGVNIPIAIPCSFVLGYTDTKIQGTITAIDIEFKACTDLRNDTTDIDKCFCFDFILN